MERDSKTRFCFICHSSDADTNIILFKKNTFEKSKYILAMRLYFNLKHSEKELPSDSNSDTVGYHNSCYRRFTALGRKYREVYDKVIKPENGESVSTTQRPEAEWNTAEEQLSRPEYYSERESSPVVNDYESTQNLCEEVYRSTQNLCEEDQYSICCGCLSFDRHVKPLTEFVDLFASLLGDQNNDIKWFNMKLCWECMALLKRIKIFQQRLLKARFLLTTLHSTGSLTAESVSTLSTLSTMQQDPCEEVVHHDSEERTTTDNSLNEIKDIKYEFEEYLDDFHDQSDEQDMVEEVVENCMESKSQDGNIEFEVGIVNLKTDQNADADKHDLISGDSNKIFNVKTEIKNKIKLGKSTMQKSVVDEIISEIDNSKGDQITFDAENKQNLISEDNLKKCNVKKIFKFRNNVTNKISKIPSNEIILCKDFLTMNLWNKTEIKKIKRDLDTLCDATIVKTDIDLSDIRNVCKYYTEVKMSKQDLEEVLEKKRQNLDFISMKFKCELCARGFRISGNLTLHRKFFHTQAKVPSECLMCKRKFPTRHAMITHTVTQHSTLRCRVCDQLCWGRSMPVTHLKTHLFTYTCNFCSKRFSSIDSFVCHRMRVHRDFICDMCGHKTISKRAMVKHLRSHATEPLECKECDKRFSSRSTYRNHVALVHAVAEHDREACYCVECDRQFNNMRQYNYHLKTSVRHNKPRQRGEAIACTVCGKMVTRKYMRNHFSLYHLKKNNHHCEICDKYFVTNYSVKKHRMYVHDKKAKPRNKVCNVCGRAFNTNRILINHMRTHTGEKPFSCKYCGVSFAQKIAMKTHERRHTKLVS